MTLSTASRLIPLMLVAPVLWFRDVGLGMWGIVAIAAVVIVLILGLVVIFKQN